MHPSELGPQGDTPTQLVYRISGSCIAPPAWFVTLVCGFNSMFGALSDECKEASRRSRGAKEVLGQD